MKDAPNRQPDNPVDSVFGWLSSLLPKNLLSVIVVFIILTILGSTAVVSVTFARTQFQQQSLAIQGHQLKNLQSMVDLHGDLQKQLTETIKEKDRLEEVNENLQKENVQLSRAIVRQDPILIIPRSSDSVVEPARE